MKNKFFAGIIILGCLCLAACKSTTTEEAVSANETTKASETTDTIEIQEQSTVVQQSVMHSGIAAIPGGAAVLKEGRLAFYIDSEFTESYDYNYVGRWKDLAYVYSDGEGTICAIDEQGEAHFDSNNGRILTMVMENLDKQKKYRKILYDDYALVLLDLEGNVEAFSYLGACDFFIGEEMERVRAWKNVVDVAFCFNSIMALFEDGTVNYVVLSEQEPYFSYLEEWTDIKMIQGAGECFAGLRTDGKVKIAGTFIGPFMGAQLWSGITQISMAHQVLMGVTEAGKVVAAGNIAQQTLDQLALWENVETVAAGSFYCVGITKEGEVLTVERKPGY